MDDAMLSTSANDSRVFRRATGKEAPKLTSPTAIAFKESEWEDLIKGPGLSSRDVSIAATALLIGRSLATLRNQYVAKLFKTLSAQQVVSFAVADANRTFAILRSKNLEAIRAQAAGGSAYNGPGTVNRKLDLGPNTEPVTADDMNTTTIDTIPHWIAQARNRQEIADDSQFDFDQAGPATQAIMSLEHALTDIWQQMLWEPWGLSSQGKDWRVEPPDERSHALWRAWPLREQANLVHRTMLSRHKDATSLVALVHLTVVAVEQEAEQIRPVLGQPDMWQTRSHASAIEIIDRSYVGPFLDQSISTTRSDLTPRLLTLAIGILQDFGALALPEDFDVDYKTQADIDRLCCSMPTSEFKRIIAEGLQIDEGLAEACLDHLTSDAFGPLTPLFRDGCWHRPLIPNQDGSRLSLILGSLIWGAPIRRVERWLKVAEQDEDLSSTPTGMAHEREIRQRMQKAIRKNPILDPVSSDVALAPWKTGEDIDAVVRIGSTVLVVEIKCFLAPTEPIERHNYISKLEGAAEQASRKAHWLAADPSRLPPELKSSKNENLRYVPLVVVNQSAGTSCRFDDVVVVDDAFFLLYLSSGSFHSAAAMDFGPDGKATFATEVLYSTAQEGEDAIPGAFEAHVGLSRYLDAIAWDTRRIPLHDRTEILMASSLFDPDKYTASLPAIDTLK